eukprot:2141738-Rhodomonas_salina.1
MIVDSGANLMFVNSLGVLVNLRPSNTNVSTFGRQIRAEWDSDIDGYVESNNGMMCDWNVPATHVPNVAVCLFS